MIVCILYTIDLKVIGIIIYQTKNRQYKKRTLRTEHGNLNVQYNKNVSEEIIELIIKVQT